jgi:quercetin dioxygenase-like cupin family protein
MKQSELVSPPAAMAVRSDEGLSVRWGPSGVLRILAGADSTDGSFSVVEVTEPPGSAAPLHVHHAEAEAFYVLEGEIELSCGEQNLTAGAGDFVYTPKGVPHKYSVVGQQPARVLLLFSRPGFEMFFAEGGTPLDQPPAGPPDIEEFQRLVRKYDMELLEAPGH